MQDVNASSATFEPCCLATTIGSLPHTDVALGTRLVLESTPEIPSWVQFPRRVFYENMMIQFTEGMPGLVEDTDGERVLDLLRQLSATLRDRHGFDR